MVNPPDVTKMVADDRPNVKVRMLRPTEIDGKVVAEGQTVEVSAAKADELLKPFDVPTQYRGERDAEEAKRLSKGYRAERL